MDTNYGRELPAEAVVMTRLRGRDRYEIQEYHVPASPVSTPMPAFRWDTEQFPFYWNGEMYTATTGEIRRELSAEFSAQALGKSGSSPVKTRFEVNVAYEIHLSIPSPSCSVSSCYGGGDLVVPIGYGRSSLSGVALLTDISRSESTTDVVFRMSGWTFMPSASLYGVMALCGEKYPVGEPEFSQGPFGVITTVPVLIDDVPEIGRVAYGPLDIRDQSKLVLRGYASAIAWKPSPCRTHVECSMSTKLSQYDVGMTVSEKEDSRKQWISELLGDGVASRVASRAARAYLDIPQLRVQVREQRSAYETAQDIKRARG